jgi:hypothetical protein
MPPSLTLPPATGGREEGDRVALIPSLAHPMRVAPPARPCARGIRTSLYSRRVREGANILSFHDGQWRIFP